MRRCLMLLVGLGLAGCSTAVDQPDIGNRNDGGTLSAPIDFDAVVSDNAIKLSWDVVAEEADTAKSFAVYRKELDPTDGRSEAQVRIAEVSKKEYFDATVRNGRRYAYQVAAAFAKGGSYGKRTDEITVTPGLFSMVINNGQPYTRSRNVTLTLTAPANMSEGSVRFSEEPDFTDAVPIAYNASRTWTLSAGDGPKTLYAVFRTSEGTQSEVVSDDITLDRQAVIHSVDYVGDDVRNPGDEIHFILDAGEPDGEAHVTVTGIWTNLVLFDDGTNGDAAANDGVYERTTVIPLGTRQDQAAVTGSFTDAADNGVGGVKGLRPLTVVEAPDVVTLSPPLYSDPPAGAKVTLRYTKSQIPDFDKYELFRSPDAQVDSTDQMVSNTNDASNLELSDNTVVEGETYYYRLYVRNDVGQQTGSNTVIAEVPNVRPPGAVTLSPVDGAAEDRLGISWSRSGDEDFAGYILYRSTDGFVDENDSEIANITDREDTRFADTGLMENTEYFYRIFVEDTAGLTASSSQISGTTKNLAPPAVSLMEASQVDTMAATLTWESSDVHDFDSYRLYRDIGPGVGTFSTLVVEVKEAEVTTFRDSGLDPNTTYYYRVFVVDDGTNPGPMESGSNVVSFTTQDTP